MLSCHNAQRDLLRSVACECDAPLSALYDRKKTIKRQPGGVSIRTGFTPLPGMNSQFIRPNFL